MSTLQSSLHMKAARRFETGARINLARRRAWYDADPTPPTPPQDGGKDKPPEPDKPKLPDGAPDWIADPEKAWAEIKKQRAENAKRRVEDKQPDKPKADEPPTADDRIAALEKKAAASERRALVAEIAAEFGLPKALAARLQGDSEEELREDAESLKAFVPKADGEGKDDKKPTPDARQKTTTTVPQGGAAAETDAQRRARLYGGSTQVFQGGGVVYNGNQTDLELPPGAAPD